MRRARRCALTLTVAVAMSAPAAAQEAPAAADSAATGTAATAVRTGVAADTIRVGDVVPVAVRLTVARDQRVVWPDTLPLTGTELENAARVRERVDTLPDGRLERTAVYAVTPWRTGELALPAVSVTVVRGDEAATTARVALPVLDVLSVLPEDTAGIEPRPAKGVIGPSWAWWPWALLLLLLAAVIAGLVAWLRRRRAAGVAPELPTVSPRERALAALDRAREAGLLERGDMKELYTRISDALRDYLAALDPAWGEDLTTTELLGRVRAQVGPGSASGLADVLRPADQVKFARRAPDADTAAGEWESARSWVLAFDWPPVPDVQEAAA